MFVQKVLCFVMTLRDDLRIGLLHAICCRTAKKGNKTRMLSSWPVELRIPDSHQFGSVMDYVRCLWSYFILFNPFFPFIQNGNNQPV